MSVPPRHLTDHAIARYQSRINRDATREQIQVVLDDGHLRSTPPGGLTPAPNAVSYIVNGPAVFPLDLKHNGYVAVTCLCRRRPCKADRRALREWAREEQEWAA